MAAVVFEIGQIDGGNEDQQAVMRNLLTSNFMPWRGVHAPTFACHPQTGDAVLQCVLPILDTPPDGLFKLIDEGVGIALQWRADLQRH